MRIDKDNDDIAMVLSRQDMVDLKNFLDNHLMIPKVSSDFSITYPSGGTWQVADKDRIDPTDTWEIFGKLIRALDIIVDNKEVTKNE